MDTTKYILNNDFSDHDFNLMLNSLKKLNFKCEYYEIQRYNCVWPNTEYTKKVIYLFKDLKHKDIFLPLIPKLGELIFQLEIDEFGNELNSIYLHQDVWYSDPDIEIIIEHLFSIKEKITFD